MNSLAAELEDLGGADITKALEELPVRSFVVDTDGYVRWQNPASREAIGDLTGRKWYEVMSENQTPDIDTIVRRIIYSGDPAEATFDVRESDGRMVPREVSAAPLREGGAVVGLFGVSVPAPTTASGPAPTELPLTKRQLEVLQLLAEGKSTQQIADELYLSKTTVRNHIAHLMANLGVHTRVQAVIAASRAGLIHMPKQGS
jgi:PAS domain S-box-containing protein